jgi:hypothetical protein
LKGGTTHYWKIRRCPKPVPDSKCYNYVLDESRAHRFLWLITCCSNNPGEFPEKSLLRYLRCNSQDGMYCLPPSETFSRVQREEDTILNRTVRTNMINHSFVRMRDRMLAVCIITRDVCTDEEHLEIHHIVNDDLDIYVNINVQGWL